MTDAVEMLDDRHPCIAADPLDQTLAAARDDDVDELGHGDHGTDRRAIGRGDHLHAVGRQTGLDQTLPDAGRDRLIRREGLGAAAQQGCVARFETEPGGIRGHVGS